MRPSEIVALSKNKQSLQCGVGIFYIYSVCQMKLNVDAVAFEGLNTFASFWQASKYITAYE